MLMNGAPDILNVALAAGYSSHEAFTRAFREQFGITPEMLRAQGHGNNLSLVEAIMMNSEVLDKLEPPRRLGLPSQPASLQSDTLKRSG